MYSPKIREELIPVLYRLAQHKRMPMTKLVDGLLRESIAQYQAQQTPETQTPKEKAHVESVHVVFQ